MSDETIVVYQRNEPTLTFFCSLRRPGGALVPYPTTGKTFEFYIKDRKEDPDPAAIPAAVDAANSTPTATAIAVKLSAAQVGGPGTRHCRLDAMPGRQTIVVRRLVTEAV